MRHFSHLVRFACCFSIRCINDFHRAIAKANVTRSRLSLDARVGAGFSVPTADQAAEVVGEADRRAAAGDEAGASALLETLNNESVAEAHRVATRSPEQSQVKGPTDPAGQLIPEQLRPIFEADALLAKAQKGLGAAHAALVQLAKSPANVFGTQELQTDIGTAHGAIKFCRPFIACPVCTRGRIEKARAAGMDDNLLNALVDIVSSINAGVAAATAREAFGMAEASSAEECGALCSPEVSTGR